MEITDAPKPNTHILSEIAVTNQKFLADTGNQTTAFFDP
jgi:hypothetical protein